MAKKNHRSAHATADYFLLKIHVEAGDLISNLKMQKLCYLAQGWSLTLRGRCLFDDVIEAWALGPMVPTLYRRFKPYRWGPLDAHKFRTDPLKELDAEEREFLDWVWEAYGRCSGSELRDITCTQTPWKEAYGDTVFPERCEKEITQKSMKAYFVTQKPPRRWNTKNSKAA